MSENLIRKPAPDRSKIDMHQPQEVHHWTRHLNVEGRPSTGHRHGRQLRGRGSQATGNEMNSGRLVVSLERRSAWNS
jgi:hypothetical protein